MTEQLAGALHGLRVLDLTRVVAGPYAGAILGDLGADVIKIEIPGRGDDARGYGPYKNGESTYYANLNRNKRGITLNLKHPAGKRLFLKMAERCDVVLENFRPQVMERLGLGYEALRQVNERIIYAAVSGFGSWGPYSDRPGYDILSQAMGGLMSVTGAKNGGPTRSGNAMGDMLGGMNLVIGVLAAVNARHRTGRGQRIDVALVDSVVASLENAYERYFDNGKVPVRNGNAYASIAPYDAYQASDGWVIIACGNQKLYEKLCRDVLDMPWMIDDERFATVPLRVQNNELQKRYIEQWTTRHTVEEVTAIALDNGIPAGPILDVSQIVRDAHIAGAREMFVEVEHPVIGKMTVNGNPVKMSETPPRIATPSPVLGQHNDDIYRGWLGLSGDEMDVLRSDGVI